jgi:small subunit ribosomal protein S20
MGQNPDICALKTLRLKRLANSAQARKRVRQNTVSRVHNASQRSALRTSIKNFLKTIDEGDKEASRAAYTRTVSAIDVGVNKGLHHKNRAARLKSRLNTRLKNLVSPG